MKATQLFNSLPILEKLKKLALPIKKAHQVYILTNQINEQTKFFINEEQKLIEKFNAEMGEGGRVNFKSAEDQQAFLREHADLMNYEVTDITPVTLKYDDLGDATFSAEDIALFDGVVLLED